MGKYMVSDNERRHLFAVLEERLGPEPAATMMELLPAGGGADLARRSDLVAFKAEVRGEMAELRGEVRELRGEMRGDVGELKGQIAQLSAHVDSLLPKQIAANVGSMIAMAGLVIAAAKFL